MGGDSPAHRRSSVAAITERINRPATSPTVHKNVLYSRSRLAPTSRSPIGIFAVFQRLVTLSNEALSPEERMLIDQHPVTPPSSPLAEPISAEKLIEATEARLLFTNYSLAEVQKALHACTPEALDEFYDLARDQNSQQLDSDTSLLIKYIEIEEDNRMNPPRTRRRPNPLLFLEEQARLSPTQFFSEHPVRYHGTFVQQLLVKLQQFGPMPKSQTKILLDSSAPTIIPVSKQRTKPEIKRFIKQVIATTAFDKYSPEEIMQILADLTPKQSGPIFNVIIKAPRLAAQSQPRSLLKAGALNLLFKLFVLSNKPLYLREVRTAFKIGALYTGSYKQLIENAMAAMGEFNLESLFCTLLPLTKGSQALTRNYYGMFTWLLENHPNLATKLRNNKSYRALLADNIDLMTTLEQLLQDNKQQISIASPYAAIYTHMLDTLPSSSLISLFLFELGRLVTLLNENQQANCNQLKFIISHLQSSHPKFTNNLTLFCSRNSLYILARACALRLFFSPAEIACFFQTATTGEQVSLFNQLFLIEKNLNRGMGSNTYHQLKYCLSAFTDNALVVLIKALLEMQRFYLPQHDARLHSEFFRGFIARLSLDHQLELLMYQLDEIGLPDELSRELFVQLDYLLACIPSLDALRLPLSEKTLTYVAWTGNIKACFSKEEIQAIFNDTTEGWGRAFILEEVLDAQLALGGNYPNQLDYCLRSLELDVKEVAVLALEVQGLIDSTPLSSVHSRYGSDDCDEQTTAELLLVILGKFDFEPTQSPALSL